MAFGFEQRFLHLSLSQPENHWIWQISVTTMIVSHSLSPLANSAQPTPLSVHLLQFRIPSTNCMLCPTIPEARLEATTQHTAITIATKHGIYSMTLESTKFQSHQCVDHKHMFFSMNDAVQSAVDNRVWTSCYCKYIVLYIL